MGRPVNFASFQTGQRHDTMVPARHARCFPRFGPWNVVRPQHADQAQYAQTIPQRFGEVVFQVFEILQRVVRFHADP